MPNYDFKVKTAATIQPVDLPKTKTNLRVEQSETFWDDEINDLLEEATEEVSDQSDRSFGATQYTLRLPRFPRRNGIYLPRPPLVSVDEIRYADSAGDPQTFTDFRVVDGMVAMLFPAYGFYWPSIQTTGQGLVEIDYTAGHACQSDIPKQARRAILILVNQRFKNREDPKIPMAVTRLINQMRPGDEMQQPIMEGAAATQYDR